MFTNPKHSKAAFYTQSISRPVLYPQVAQALHMCTQTLVLFGSLFYVTKALLIFLKKFE